MADEQVKSAARKAFGGTPPPRITKADWAKRNEAKVTLTRSEMEQLARLVGAGHVMLRNEPSISPRLRAAMTRMGVSTKGL